jgi:hypothetical protein
MAQGSHAGRLGSWLAVIIIWIGFGAGGVALVIGPAWWLFWLGVGIAALGGVIGLSVGIFDDVILDVPRADRTDDAVPADRRGEVGPGDHG